MNSYKFTSTSGKVYTVIASNFMAACLYINKFCPTIIIDKVEVTDRNVLVAKE